MTTDQNAPDEVLDPADRDAARRATDEATRTDAGTDLNMRALVPHRNPYDVAVPETLRERLAYARALSSAGILPRDYAGKPANVLVAGEMGRELGLSTVQSVLMLNVVEGRPQLGANGVRAVVQQAGHHIGPAVLTYSDHGIPEEASVTGQRMRWDRATEQYVEDSEPVTIVWNIARAHRAGLCSVKRNESGAITEVRARSQSGKVLPWEAYTEDMLDARATVKLGRTLFADVTMGLSYERDELESTAPIMSAVQVTEPRPPAEPTARAQEVLQQVKPQRRTDLPDDYDPSEDAQLFSNGDEWHQHAGAQVSRRSKQQLAADRIAKWVADNPDQDVVPMPTPAGEVGPHVYEPTGTDPASSRDRSCVHCGGFEDDPEVDHVVDAEIVDETPAGPEPELPDPHDGADPWAGTMEPTDEPVTDEPVVDDTPTDAMGDDGPALDPLPDDAEPEGVAAWSPTAAELLAEIEAAAELVGKSRQALMVRWIASHRKNPENATADELMPFVEQLRQTLAARG